MGKLGSTVALAVLAVLTVACSTTPYEPGRTTTTLPSDRGPVIVTEPGSASRPAVVTEPSRGQVTAAHHQRPSVGGLVNHKVIGRVTDINRNSGQITIRTPEGGKMDLILPPLSVASIREGDDVAVDVSVNPARR